MLINLTPHRIHVHDQNNPEICRRIIEPCGTVARIDQPWGAQKWIEGSIPVKGVAIGVVTNVPSPSEGTTYIVSRIVAERLAVLGRWEDIVCPDTTRKTGGVFNETDLIGVRQFCQITPDVRSKYDLS